MGISPLAVKYGVMGIVCGIWLACYKGALQWNSDRPFHVAEYQRSRNKSRFYMLSVWIGLGCALAGLIGAEAIPALPIGAAPLRDLLVAVARGLGFCGLLMVAAVWSQVGRRVLEPHSDEQSIQPLREDRPAAGPSDGEDYRANRPDRRF
jgi:hypothetical protein